MKILSFNSKGGCGKSLIAREIIAAPNAAQTVMIEIDQLNKTQLSYKKDFKEVIELDKNKIKELLIYLNEYDNCVIDIGVDNLTTTMKTLIDYQLFDELDLVVIPLTEGRTDCENALKTYMTISHYTNKIIFAFNKHDPEQTLEQQYPVFFNNIEKYSIDNIDDKHIKIIDSSVFSDAQNNKLLVIEMAKEYDYKQQALLAKSEHDMPRFKNYMEKELFKRAAQRLVESWIDPAYDKIISYES